LTDWLIPSKTANFSIF